jgi:ribosomal protein S27AE
MREKIRCPGCGALMNFHAEKVDTGTDADAPDELAFWGGVVMEFHTCPRCGAVVERPAAEP